MCRWPLTLQEWGVPGLPNRGFGQNAGPGPQAGSVVRPGPAIVPPGGFFLDPTLSAPTSLGGVPSSATPAPPQCKGDSVVVANGFEDACIAAATMANQKSFKEELADAWDSVKSVATGIAHGVASFQADPIGFIDRHSDEIATGVGIAVAVVGTAAFCGATLGVGCVVAVGIVAGGASYLTRVAASRSETFNPAAMATEMAIGGATGVLGAGAGAAGKAVAGKMVASSAARGVTSTEQFAAGTVAYRSMARDSGANYARSVVSGGRPDGATVFAGHGEYRLGSGHVAVPQGTSVKVYSAHGGALSQTDGLTIKLGGGPVAVTTYGPGSMIPNYTLKAPTGLTVAQGSRTVEDATSLGTLLRPNMGVCHWAA